MLTRTVGDSWQLANNAAERYPYIEQTAQQPSQFALNMIFAETGRYDMITSIKAEIHNCEKVLLQSSDKYLYGNDKHVWIAQTAFNISEAGGKIVKGQLTGTIDPYQIHSCDFITDWTGTALSVVTAHEGKYAVQDNIASPSGSTNYDTTYNPDWTHDLSDFTYLTFWFKNSRASTAFTAARVFVQTSDSNYYYWNLTFSSGSWAFMDCELASPDGTVGSPSLSTVGQIVIRITTADTVAFYSNIDDIRVY